MNGQERDAVATCGECGAMMRQTYVVLTFQDGCKRMPMGLECTNVECLRKQREQDRADAKAHEEAVIADALASGLIVPDDTPEEDRYV